MSETTIESRVKRVIADQLCLADDAVANDKSLIADYGADSLDLVELVMALEDEFNIEIEDDDANKATTVQDVITLVNNRKPS